MSPKQKRTLRRIALSAALFVAALLFAPKGLLRPAAFLLAYLPVGLPVLSKAVGNIRRGQVFDENLLMALASVGAFACGEYAEGVAVMLFYQVGELFESLAVAHSRRSIAALMDIRPDFANVERDGQLLQVSPEQVAVGEVILVKPGERVPLDGVVLEGASALDTTALTGESLPRSAQEGDEVLSGCINLTAVLRLRTTKPFETSTVSRILELVEHSGAKKAKTEHFITRFARWYTPAVVVCALVLALLPPILGLGTWQQWVGRALIFLVVSCPCALVISVPLSFFGGIGGASRQGILVKGGNYLEALAKADVVVFDKTGTLTHGVFQVLEVYPEGISRQELLTLTARAEHFSDHPIARSVRAEANAHDLPAPTQAEELPGLGVRAQVDARTVLVGSRPLLTQAGIPCPDRDALAGTAIYTAADGVYLGCILIGDRIKDNAPRAIAALKRAGVSQTVMLSGDSEQAAYAAARTLGLNQVRARLLPGDKVAEAERLMELRRPGGTLVFVGDGINDAPVLARADVGVAMGALGSDAAIEAADVVLMDDDPAKLTLAVVIARKTLSIARQNIVLALGIKLLVLGLTVFGLSNLWLAVFADVGVSVLAICNAGRMLAPVCLPE